MKLYLIRHGQTNLNKAHLMQGRTDEPLNATGVQQAELMREFLKDVTFDAVFTSPLSRAMHTGAIVGRVDISQVHVDERLIETDFGKYEKRPYGRMGIPMSLYWAMPELFPAPKGVETIEAMVTRAHAVIREIEEMQYDNVLIAAHGGILRAVNGYLLDRKNGICWRPKMRNCEVRIYDSLQGKHTHIATKRANETI